jgi:hypothetical protein
LGSGDDRNDSRRSQKIGYSTSPLSPNRHSLTELNHSAGSALAGAILAVMNRPDRSEAAAYYFTYIDLVPDGDICELLVAQVPQVLQLTRSVTEAQSLHRYAPGKWSVTWASCASDTSARGESQTTRRSKPATARSLP